MKSALAMILLCSLAATSFAKDSHAVKGYTKKDGTYVEPHRATNPDNTKVNNYSAKGNVNPYTGKEGTKHPLAPTKKK